MRSNLLLVASITLLGAAGCMLGPDYQAPPAPADEAFASVKPPPPLPEWAQWWKPFEWPELDATMVLALEGNRDLVVAQARWDESLARAGVTVAEASPQVSVEPGVGRQKYGFQFLGPQDVPPFHYWSVTASANWLVDYLGGQRRAAERDAALADYQHDQLDAAYLTVTGNILIQAIAAASARVQIDAVEQILERDQRMVDLGQKAFAAGQGTRTDVLNAQSQLARDRTLLPPLRQDLARADHQLAVLVGRSAADWAPPGFAFDHPVPLVAPTVPSAVLRTRPDIMAAESELHAATAAVGVAVADLYPQIRLGASFGPQANSLTDIFDEDSLASSLIAGVTIPLLDGGALQARRDAAQAALRASLAQYEQTVLMSFAQVADLLEALQHDAELLDAQQAAGEAAAQRLALARQSHAAGNAGIQPILDAERTGFMARLGHAQAMARQREDTARLMLAVGGGIVPLSP